MRYQWRSLCSALLVGGVLLVGCSEAPEPPVLDGFETGELPVDHPDIGQAPAQMAGGGPTGVVLETGPTTYVPALREEQTRIDIRLSPHKYHSEIYFERPV